MPNPCIAPKYLPSRPPILLTLAIWTAMDFYQSSDLWRGVLVCLIGVLWVTFLIGIGSEKWASPAEIDARDPAGPPGHMSFVRKN